MQNLFVDVRHALRAFRQAPTLPFLTVLALSLGIGANTAIFSAFDALVLRANRMPAADRVVQVWDQFPNRDGSLETQISVPNYEDYAASQTVFERFAALQPTTVYLEGGSGFRERSALHAASDLLPILGVRPALGRAFRPDEDRQGTPRTVVISQNLWIERFGGSPDVLDRTLEVTVWSQNERRYVSLPHEIVGVLPEGFALPPMRVGGDYRALAPPDLILPLGLWEWGRDNRGMYAFRAVGRLAEDRSLPDARAQLATIAAGIAETNPETNAGYSVAVNPLKALAWEAYGPRLLLLWGAAALVLLIACANVAALLIGRSVARQRELAVRKALGAGAGRILRQLVTESGVLALAGALGGLATAYVVLASVAALSPAPLAALVPVDPDLRVLAFGIAVALGTVLLFGVGPSLSAARLDVGGTLRQGHSGAGRSLRALRGLVAAQIALAFVLMTGTGLLLASLANMLRSDVGFDPDGRYLLPPAQLVQGLTRYDSDEEQWLLYERIREAVLSLPGATALAMIDNPPLSGRESAADFTPADRPPIAPEDRVFSDWGMVTPDYFETMGIQVREGRTFMAEDVEASRPESALGRGGPLPELPVVVSAALARHYWPGESAVGKIGYWGVQDPAALASDRGGSTVDPRYPAPRPLRVIGVVDDVKQLGMSDASRRHFYTLRKRLGQLALHLEGDPASLLPRVRERIEAVDPELQVVAIVPFQERVEAMAGSTRFQLLLVGLFAALATVMAMLGLFGTLAYAVRQRSREIGIRMSVGATAGRVRAMILGEGLRLVMIGGSLGVLGSLASGRVVRGVLFEVAPTSAAVLAGAALALALASLLGVAVPLHRAGRLDPADILRTD